MGVERGAINPAVVDRRALVGYAAAHDARRLGRPIERLLPDLLAGDGVDRDRRPRVGDVHHAVVDDRLRLLAPVVVQAQVPHRHQAPDRVLVDLPERTVALLVDRKSTRLNSSHTVISYAG